MIVAHILLTPGHFGSGMHEVLCRKDMEGQVRVYFRKSSQASNWLPEGDGMLVFKSIPEGQPPIAKMLKRTVSGGAQQWKKPSENGIST